MPKRLFSFKESLLINYARLHVVDALYVRDIRAQAGVGQCPVLTYGFPLQIRGPRSANGLPLG